MQKFRLEEKKYINIWCGIKQVKDAAMLTNIKSLNFEIVQLENDIDQLEIQSLIWKEKKPINEPLFYLFQAKFYTSFQTI